jgi:hypothetical protein
VCYAAERAVEIGGGIGLPSGNLERRTMRGLGRLLQMVGLILLPVAIVMQISDTIMVGKMLLLSAVGVCAFAIGWILSTYRFG